MKIKCEREQRGAKVFTKNEFVEKEKCFEKEIRPSLKGTPKDLPYMQFLFYNTKEEFKDDQLFEENKIIKIRQNSFEQILEKFETYNLSDTQDDVKGIALKDLLSGTIKDMLETDIDDHLGYIRYERSGEPNYRYKRTLVRAVPSLFYWLQN